MKEHLPHTDKSPSLTISELDVSKPEVFEECFILDAGIQTHVESQGHPGWYEPMDRPKLHKFLNKPGHIIGARDSESKLLGYAKLEVRDLYGEERYHLPGTGHHRMLEVKTIGAIPRQGVGRQLMQESERIAKQQSCTDIGLSVSVQNTPAQRFYESCGLILFSTMLCESYLIPRSVGDWGEDSVKWPYYKYIGEDNETQKLYSHTRLNRKLMHLCSESPDLMKPIKGGIVAPPLEPYRIMDPYLYIST